MKNQTKAPIKIPKSLIRLRKNMDAANQRYIENSGENATVALMIWSDTADLYYKAAATYSARENINIRLLETIVQLEASRKFHLW
ncbi:hypothetical protein ACIP5U_39360 [Streptomyces sp. NPDC088788]|uniref:hypothetical protein n=1 Tax=Streptomyces sp. NPDC088788 TaxID=3365898 RepID=UPI0037FB3E8F